MINKWQTIWEKREISNNIYTCTNPLKVYEQLKKIDGYDLTNVSLKALLAQHEIIKNNIAQGFADKNFKNVKSIYEIGCGCGANLYLFEQEGLTVGGGDYSKTLIDTALKILKSSDIKHAQAVDISPVPQYDVVLSNGVFEYFFDLEYAKKVLEIAYQKSREAIALVDVYDETKKEDFYNFRRQKVKDFDKLYEDLPKLFYSREFFINFAKEHNMKIEFKKPTLEGYWNNDFIFSVYMYKN